MDRTSIKNLSDRIAERYARMLSEHTTRNTSERIRPQHGLECLYVRVEGLSNVWEQRGLGVADYMAQLIAGFYSVELPLSVVFENDGKELSVLLGSTVEGLEVLLGMLQGVFPQAALKRNDSGNPVVLSSEQLEVSWRALYCFGGFVKGNPLTDDCQSSDSPIDEVIRGMAGKPWAVIVSAVPEDVRKTVKRQHGWASMASWCSAVADVSYSDSDNVQTTTYRQHYLTADQYSKRVEAYYEHTAESVTLGEWCVVCNYGARTLQDSGLLGGLLTSAFYGTNAMPEPVHAIVRTYDNNMPFVPLANGWEYTHTTYLGDELAYPRYASLLSSRELAQYVSLPDYDVGGMALVDHVQFDIHRGIWGDLELGTILDGAIPTGIPYAIDVNELNRHALVVGLTGSGKTNTTKSLLCTMTKHGHLPFMVIEPAKKEYWELFKLGYDDLQVYSIGSTERGAHKLCINPFERPLHIDADGISHSVSIQTHIDFVYAAFKASFIMYTPMPYVLERAIYEIYEDCGWDIHADTCVGGQETYPTIEDLYFKIPEVVVSMGYDQRMRNDLIGSLQARINSLRLGSKGDALNVPRSFSFDELLRGKVVVELEDIGDDDVKAFIMSLLLINLLEVRRQQPDAQLEVRHLLLMEEAHRLLKNVQGGTGESADPRAAAVDFFCNLLAELRSKGQGFIVADQIPSKLAPDLVKNTNLKICHRIVAADERELMGGAMHMREDQIEALASLRQGVAAVYSEGDERPKLVKPPYAGSHVTPCRERITRDQVLYASSRHCISTMGNSAFESLTDSQTEVCRRCDAHCRRKPSDILARMHDAQAFDLLASKLDPNSLKSCQALRIDRNIRNMLDHSIPNWDATDTKSRYCVLELLLERWDLDSKLETKLINIYMERL